MNPDNDKDFGQWSLADICSQHVDWICELTGLHRELMILVQRGYGVLTDESCSEVWLLSADRWNTTARLIFKEEEQ